MYVRDCSNKVGMDNFHIRVASQGREKDAKLVNALADVAPMKRPVVLVVTRRTIRKNKFIDYVGEFHLELLIRAADSAGDGSRRRRRVRVPPAVHGRK